MFLQRFGLECLVALEDVILEVVVVLARAGAPPAPALCGRVGSGLGGWEAGVSLVRVYLLQLSKEGLGLICV